MTIWKTASLGSLIINYDNKRSPLSAIERARRKGPYPYYGATCIFDYVDDYLFDGEYILLGEDGTVINPDGSPVLQLVDGKFWVNNHAHILRNTADIDFYFLYYLLKNLNIRHIVTGTVQPKISQRNLNSLQVTYPKDIELQQKIANYLKLFDSKIELNTCINKNLEKQAQALFKSWFIDFEPFGGTMPDDWKHGCLLDIATYLNGLTMQKFRASPNEESIPVLKIKELRQGFCDSNSDLCSANIDSSYIVEDGDVIFSWSGSLLVDIWCGGCAGLNQHLFKVNSSKYDKWFYYSWTKHHIDHFISVAADKATTMGHIKRNELEKAEVIIPSSIYLQKIGQIIAPIYDLIIQNRIENTRLALIRDTLLPKLMSGEINLSKVDTEKIIINKE